MMLAGHDPGLLLRLLAVLLVFLGLCWFLARGLGVRLGRTVLVLGLLAPLVVLFPWLSGQTLLAPTSALSGIIPGGPLVAPTDRHELLNDTLYQLLPWELEIRHAFAERRLPFWSDSLEGGSSPWGNPQAAALSPFSMAARIFPIQHHLLACLAMKVLVAFLGTWILARFAGRSKGASLLAAAGFSLGGGIFAWGLFPISSAAAWTPWLAAGTIRLFRHPSPRAFAVAAVATAALLLAGHPETALAGGLFAVVAGLGLRRRRAPFAKSFAAAAGAAILGIMLAAPHLLPFLQQMRESQRAAETMTHTLPPHDATWNRPATWFLPEYTRFVLAPTNPHAYGRPYREPFRGPFNWADSEPGYTGLLAFAGTLIALFALRDRRLRPFLGFSAVTLLLASRFLPVAYLLYAIPGLQVPAYARFLAAGSLGLCVAAAFGIDALRRPFSLRRSRLWLAWAGAGVATALSLAVTADSWTVSLWCALLAGFALLSWRPHWGAIALGAVLLVDLVPWSQSLLPQGHPALFYPKTELTDRLAALAGNPAEGRAVGAAHLLYSNLLPVYGIADVRPHNPLAPVTSLRVLDAAFGFHPTMGNYFAAFGNVDHPLLDFLGVRAVVGSPAIPTPQTLEDVAPGRYAPFSLYRNPDPLPRWFIPTEIDTIERQDLKAWIAAMQSPTRVALIRDELGGGSPLPVRGIGSPGMVRASLAIPGKINLELPRSDRETLLATSIPFAKGWRATAPDRRLPLLTVNGAFVGVRIPAGTARVELSYRPPGFLLGCALTFISGILLLAMLVRGRLGQRTAS